MMNNGFYGAPVNNSTAFFDACQQQENFDRAYAAATARGSLDYVQSETKSEDLEQVDIKNLLKKISPSAVEKVKDECQDIFGIKADDKKKAAEKKEDKKEEAKEEKDDSKAEIEIDDNDRELIPIHSVAGNVTSIEIERCSNSLFSQIFADFIGTRVNAIDVHVPDPRTGKTELKTLVSMELQFCMSAAEATDGKIKNVVTIEDELDTNSSASSELGELASMQRSLGKQKANLKLNKLTRKILTPFISKDVFINTPNGMEPDWRNIETNACNVGQPQGNNCLTNGAFVVSVKIDIAIFISKLMSLLKEITPDKYIFKCQYLAPADPSVVASAGGGYSFWNVWRSSDKLPFIIRVETVSIKEELRLMRLTGTGRYGRPCGVYYNPAF